jgi:hypothetical protein
VLSFLVLVLLVVCVWFRQGEGFTVCAGGGTCSGGAGPKVVPMDRDRTPGRSAPASSRFRFAQLQACPEWRRWAAPEQAKRMEVKNLSAHFSPAMFLPAFRF